MTTPLTYNLDNSGIRDLMLYGNPTVFMVGDSTLVRGRIEDISGALWGGALASWGSEGSPGLRGVFAPGSVYGVNAGFYLLPRASGMLGANATGSSYTPNQDGYFSLANQFPLKRHEWQFTGNIANDTLMGRYYINAPKLRAVDGTYPWWHAATAFFGKTVTVSPIVFKHPEGATVKFRTRYLDVTGVYGAYVTKDLSGDIEIIDALAGEDNTIAVGDPSAEPAEDAYAQIGCEVWTADDVTEGSVESPTGLVELGYVLNVAGGDGMLIGALGTIGMNSDDAVDWFNADRISEFMGIVGGEVVFPIYMDVAGCSDGEIAKAAFKANMTTLIDRLTTACTSQGLAHPKFILTPMWISDGGEPSGDYADAMYEICQSASYRPYCGLINLYRMCGGDDHLNWLKKWLIEDGYHLGISIGSGTDQTDEMPAVMMQRMWWNALEMSEDLAHLPRMRHRW